jgi:hypothetical protein
MTKTESISGSFDVAVSSKILLCYQITYELILYPHGPQDMPEEHPAFRIFLRSS